MNKDRIVRQSTVKGAFFLPLGLTLSHPKQAFPPVASVNISTVCLEDGHLDAPVRGIVDEEHGYETMIFLEGETFFGVYKRHYETRREAVRGHAQTVRKLLAGKLPLSISLGTYCAFEEVKTQEKKS